MAKAKIDKMKLSRMLSDGKPQVDCARYFGVTKSAISKAAKELNIAVVKNVTLENAHRVVNRNLNTLDQLQKINDNANEMLDLLMRWNRGDEEALQILECQVKKVRRRDGSEDEVTEYRMKDPRELALKAMAEIRAQLNLQLDIFKTLYDLRTVEEFQNVVLDAIGEVSRDTRKKIIDRLRQKRAVRSLITE